MHNGSFLRIFQAICIIFVQDKLHLGITLSSKLECSALDLHYLCKNKNKKYEKTTDISIVCVCDDWCVDFVGADVESIDVECEAGIEWRF